MLLKIIVWFLAILYLAQLFAGEEKTIIPKPIMPQIFAPQAPVIAPEHEQAPARYIPQAPVIMPQLKPARYKPQSPVIIPQATPAPTHYTPHMPMIVQPPNIPSEPTYGAPQPPFIPQPVMRELNQIETILQAQYPAAFTELQKLNNTFGFYTRANDATIYNELIRPLPHTFEQLTNRYCELLAAITLHPNNFLKPTILNFAPENHVTAWIFRTVMSSRDAYYIGSDNRAIGLYIRLSIFGRLFGLTNIRKNIAQPFFEFHELPDPEQLAQDKNPESFKTLVSEYKIHLNPSDPYYQPMILNFLRLVANNKAFFEQNIYGFKFAPINEALRQRAGAAAIVIYVYGKEKAQRVLDFIYQAFKEYPDPGCSWEPSYNEKVTPILFFAQGGRDMKNKAAYKDLFDPGMVYFKEGLTTDPITGEPDDYRLHNPAK